MNLVISITLQGSSFPVSVFSIHISVSIDTYSFIHSKTVLPHRCQIMRLMDKTSPHQWRSQVYVYRGTQGGTTYI